ncbi:MAG: UDP-N-acetylmuramate--L-alanine ligase [Bacteroidales bacterium]|nr:UDP-N-acetylmuramate--L-alanine ligase [Bacteroidales bacterium]
MKLSEVNTVYFVGIGGIGMSGLALYFHASGKSVSGYDRKKSPLTEKLMAKGIEVRYADDINNLPQNIELVIYTPAVPAELNLLRHFRSMGIPVRKRSDIVGQISKYLTTIAISGTHGKSSISAMIAHMLKFAEIPSLSLIGAVLKNYNSNVLIADDPEYLVIEADEYDRSFLTLFPNISVVTAVEKDHLDIYGSYDRIIDAFRKFVRKTTDKVIINTEVSELFEGSGHQRYFSYSLGNSADFSACNIGLLNDGTNRFDFQYNGGIIEGFEIGIPGLFNVENALAAIAVGVILNIPSEKIRDALKDYKGLIRRFDIQYKGKNLVYIDDYAHHPTEIATLVDAVRKAYRGKRIGGIFQPHLYSRTRDFAVEFAESLEYLDEIVLLPVYPAREQPIPDIDSGIIFEKIRSDNKYLTSKKELYSILEKMKFDVMLSIGAGDIDRIVTDIKDYVVSRDKTQ